MDLSEVTVDIVAPEDEARFRALLSEYHFLGDAPSIGETLRYVAHHHGRWVALLVFSASALKNGARDRWIGWDHGVQFYRLNLVSNNARFLLLPGSPRNLGSRVLSLCTRRLVRDWPVRFGHELLLVETFVDATRHRGTVYRAANWIEAGRTQGFARAGRGYHKHAHPKLVFLYPLCRRARTRLLNAHLEPDLLKGPPRMTLTRAQMCSLPDVFTTIDDPRRPQGRRHSLSSILALSAAAILTGARGYKAISEWVNDQSQDVLSHFRVRWTNGRRVPPSRSAIRSVLIRVDSRQLSDALDIWNRAHGGHDSALAIDGKTMRGAIDADGNRTHVLGIIGHTTKAPHAQKKWG